LLCNIVDFVQISVFGFELYTYIISPNDLSLIEGLLA